jgi:hypothetical protein
VISGDGRLYRGRSGNRSGCNVNIQYSTNQPFLSGTSGSGLAGVPGATLTLAAFTLHQPVIVLTWCRVSRLQ